MLTLVIGGARSGKSRFAATLCAGEARVTYIATAEASDAEMQARIARHRKDRPAHWTTIEAPVRLAEAASGHASASSCILIDCLTLWLSRLCWEQQNRQFDELESMAMREIAALAEAATKGKILLVTNEVGCSLVPDSAVGRRFQDLQGLANQAAAREADRVYHVVAGIPTLLKPRESVPEKYP
jgi:adenosylcobinamide kinase/adenosylcobinamide-phosphate guanylyltransferase